MACRGLRLGGDGPGQSMALIEFTQFNYYTSEKIVSQEIEADIP